MSYIINLTDGTFLTSVPDGQLDTSYGGLSLIGKSYAGFGTAFNTDLVHITENFANPTPPSNPLTGQFWYDNTTQTIQVYNGTFFKTISVSTASSTSPTNPSVGDEWFNTITQQLFVWNGTTWLLIGPTSIAGSGLNGIATGSVVQNASTYYFLDFYADNRLVTLMASDNLIDPGVPGFGNIRPGFNFSTVSTANIVFAGMYNLAEMTVGNADQLSLTVDDNNNGILSTTGSIILEAAGQELFTINSNGLIPVTSDSVSLGNATHQFANVYTQYLGINELVIGGGTPLTTSDQTGSGVIVLADSPTFITEATSPLFNATTGFQINSTAPLYHLLVGNGTEYIDSATIPAGLVNYQEIEEAGNPLTKRAILNVLYPLTAADDPTNDSTDVGLGTSGVGAGAYYSANVVVDAYGRITSASSSTVPALLASEIATLQGDVSTIDGEISTINGEITTLTNDYNYVSGCVSTMWGAVYSTIPGEITTLTNDYNYVSGCVSTMWGEVYNTLAPDVSGLNSCVATLWNEVYNTLAPEINTLTNEIAAIVNTTVTNYAYTARNLGALYQNTSGYTITVCATFGKAGGVGQSFQVAGLIGSSAGGLFQVVVAGVHNDSGQVTTVLRVPNGYYYAMEQQNATGEGGNIENPQTPSFVSWVEYMN